jgi:hypothetical protein
MTSTLVVPTSSCSRRSSSPGNFGRRHAAGAPQGSAGDAAPEQAARYPRQRTKNFRFAFQLAGTADRPSALRRCDTPASTNAVNSFATLGLLPAWRRKSGLYARLIDSYRQGS